MADFVNILQQQCEDAKQIFNLLQKRGPLMKSDLVQLAGVKLTTLNRVMEPLETAGLLLECGIGESTGGRKPSFYSVNPNKYAVVGIDISRTYTQVVITQLNIEVKFKKHFAMDETCTPQKTVDTIAEIISDGIQELGLKEDCVLGIGVGTVGPLDREEGKMINPANFSAPGWKEVPIKNMLEAKLGYPVFTDNGANVSVLAEYLFGRGINYDTVAYFHCGVGIRTGTISSGMIVRAINDMEGSFGHMMVDVDGELCSCGNYGCIECYASIPSIMNKFISLIKKGRSTIVTKSLDKVTYLDICSAASQDQDDELAKEVVVSAATMFGVGLANYINLLSPGLVILSGPLIRNSELFYKVCTETALKKCYSRIEHRVNFSNGGYFGDNSISVGAAVMVVEKLLG